MAATLLGDDALDHVLAAYYSPTHLHEYPTPPAVNSPVITHHVALPHASGRIVHRWTRDDEGEAMSSGDEGEAVEQPVDVLRVGVDTRGVCKQWRKVSLTVMKRTIERVWTTFFQACATQLRVMCVDPARHREVMYLLHHEGVSETVIKTIVHPVQNVLMLSMIHLPILGHLVDAGIAEAHQAIAADDVRFRNYQLHAHYETREQHRTQEQRAEVTAWQDNFERHVQANFMQDYRSLNARPVHVNQYRL